MRRFVGMIAMCVVMVACYGNRTKSDSTAEVQARSNVVEVLYFHGSQRCASCIAIEQVTEGLLQKEYGSELADGRLIYTKADLLEERERAEHYRVVWASLLVIGYDREGREVVTDLTDEAYGYAMTQPEGLKEQLRQAINQQLKQ